MANYSVLALILRTTSTSIQNVIKKDPHTKKPCDDT